MSLEALRKVDRAPLPPRPAYIRINRENGDREPVFKSRQGVGEVSGQTPLQANGGLGAEISARHTMVDRFGRTEVVELAPGIEVSPLEVTPES